MTKNIVFIYKIQDPRDNSVFYIGKTVNVISRFNDHKRNDSGPAKLLSRIRNIKDSGKNLIFTIIEECESNEIGKEREFYWINKYLEESHLLLNSRIKIGINIHDIRFENGVKERKFTWY